MRLSQDELEAIKKIIHSQYADAKVYLFGSRVYDDKSGGDIDILILSDACIGFKERIAIQVSLEEVIGEERIDIVSAKTASEDPFVLRIMEEAVLL